jgi:hypothetical protein
MVAKCNVYIGYTLQENIVTEGNSTSIAATRVTSDIKAAGRYKKGISRTQWNRKEGSRRPMGNE